MGYLLCMAFFSGFFTQKRKSFKESKKDTGIFNKTKEKYNLSWLVIFVVACEL